MRLFRRSDTGTWAIEFARGKVVSLRAFYKATVRDEKTAKKVFAAVRAEYLAGRLLQLKGETTTTLGEFASEYEEWGATERHKGSFGSDKLALDALRAVAGDSCRLDRLGLKHLDAMIAACRRAGNTPATINIRIRHLRALFRKAVEWEMVKSNPFAKAREVATERRPPCYIDTAAGISSFLAGIVDVDLRRLVSAYLATGRRRMELVNLEWPDVDLEGGRYLVRHAKGHLTRWYPISATLGAILRACGPQEAGHVFPRWRSPHTISRIVKAELRKAGLGHLRLHDLRHTFASEFIRQSGNIRVLQDLLGHTQASTTQIYTHVADSHLKAEIGRVSFIVDVGGKKK
jgi:integrase